MNSCYLGGIMSDQSYLDEKYFIDKNVYNCPFCNRNNVMYIIFDVFEFDWSNEKKCYVSLVTCASCEKVSLHLLYEKLTKHIQKYSGRSYYEFLDAIDDIDSKIFYSVPTSFFTMDNRIHKIIRELITEAEGCLKMNFLTGASACMRKAIYELLLLEKTTSVHYEDRIKELKSKYPDTDPELFDILGSIQDMTSDKIHEQSWDKWDSQNLKLIIETLKTVLYDIYVLPEIKAERLNQIKQLKSKISKRNNQEK